MEPLPTRFWRELRRRKVVRVLAVYGAGALVLIEGANNVLPALGVPEIVNTVVVWLVLAGLPVALALAWKFDIVPDAGSAPTPDVGPLPAERVAVLPFEDLGQSGDDQYFADGVTDDIIAKLCQIPALKVVSRTSVMKLRGSEESLPVIGSRLRAGSIVEGSVRRSKDRIRVVAQLIDANTDSHMWSETFDAEVDDLFSVQTSIAKSVATGLRATLTNDELVRLEVQAPDNPEAYDLYLKAKYLTGTRAVAALHESRSLLERAIQLDPGLPAAHAGLATSLAISALYGLDAPPDVMPRALEASTKALSLDPHSIEALNARGLIECIWAWDWKKGAATFGQAATLSPSDARAHHWYALNCLAPQGQLEEATEQLEVARSLDPLSLVGAASLGFLQYLGRDVDGAEAVLAPLVGEDDCPPIAHLFLGYVRELAGRHEQARRSYDTLVESGGRQVEALAALATSHALYGDESEARHLLARLEALAENSYVSPGRRAQVQAALGEWEVAGTLWDEAVRLRSTDLIWLAVQPSFDFARGRSEFDRATTALGIPERVERG